MIVCKFHIKSIHKNKNFIIDTKLLILWSYKPIYQNEKYCTGLFKLGTVVGLSGS